MMRVMGWMMHGVCAVGICIAAASAHAQSYPNTITAKTEQAKRQPVPQAYAQHVSVPLPLPPYQPSTGDVNAYRVSHVARPVQPQQGVYAPAPRAAVPQAPAVAYAPQPAPHAPSVAHYATMAPAAGTAPRAAVAPNGNRFLYGDVRQTVPGAKQKMDAADSPMGLDTYLGLGYRTGEMKWSIAGAPDGTSPNILSELKWDNLQMAQADAGVRYTAPDGDYKNVRIEGSAYYAYVTSGENQDSDYEFDNRQNEFSRSNNSADGSTAYGMKAAIGYELPVLDEPHGWQLKGTPLIGFQGHKQRMRMQDGNQTVCGSAPSFNYNCGGAVNLGPFAGLNSHYSATWMGPFAALEAELGYSDTHLFRVRGEYGYMNYDAEARWNLRQDFLQSPSYKHDADGDAISLSAEYRYGLDSTTGIVVSGEVQKFSADDGTDRTFLTAGGTSETKLNKVTWDSQAYRVGVEKMF